MWRLTPVEADQKIPELQGILDKRHLDYEKTPKFFKMLAKSSAAMKGYLSVEEALANGQLPPQLREQIALAVAEINGSSYCLAAHKAAGKAAGLTEEEIQLACKAAANDPKTDTMLRFVQAIVLQRGEISDDDFRALRKAGFSEGEVIEILANVVVNIFTNYFNLLAGTKPDSSLLRPSR